MVIYQAIEYIALLLEYDQIKKITCVPLKTLVSPGINTVESETSLCTPSQEYFLTILVVFILSVWLN